MINLLTKIWEKIILSYILQFLIIAVLVFIGFYKVLDFTFHANREMAYIIGLTGGDFSIINLIKSHGFISLFNLKVFGPNPAGWYLTSIILHILAVWMLIVFVGSLTKSRTIGFLTGIWFGISLVWHDVITFGSQQSMYAAELLLFFISIYFYKRFRENKNPKISYIVSYITLAINLPLRELGLIFFPILFLFDIIFYFKYEKKHSIKKNIIYLATFLIPQISFVVTSITYFMFQQVYAEVPAYFADDKVQFKANLMVQKRYLEYIIISLLSFGTYIPPHFIPYTFLNFLREITALILPINIIKIYFFSLMGSVMYIILILLTYLNRKKSYFKILIFALLTIAIPTLFYSTSVSMDQNYFLIPYQDEGNRYRYFAFFGTSLFFIVFFSNFLKSKLKKKTFYYVAAILVFVNLIMNVFLLWGTEDRMYKEMFKNQKLFYKTMLKIFPTYSKNNTLYNPPYSYSLGDYVSEWHYLSDFFYPKMGEGRKDWSYSEMEKVLQNIIAKKIDLNDIFFIDFNPGQGVIDYTSKARKEILNQKEVVILQNKILNDNKISLPISNISSSEFPYLANITLKADLNFNNSNNKNILKGEKLNQVISYTNNRLKLSGKIKVDVCATFGNMVSYDKKHLIDGDFSDRSVWNADCFPSWFTLDLGDRYDISGFLIKGLKDDPHLPSLYSYEVSTDNKSWERVMDIKNNIRSNILDKWPKTYKARYIKVTIKGTQRLGFVSLIEAEPVLENNQDIFNLWSTWEDLNNDMYNLFINVDANTRSQIINSVKYSFGRFSWKTDLLNIPENQTAHYFPFLIDGEFHTYEFPVYESEMYSFRDQFLKRKITDVSLNFSNFPGVITISDFRLKPKYPIKL